MFEFGDLDLDRPSPASPQLVVAGVREEAVEPGVKPIRIAKTGKIPPGASECLLDGVLRSIGITQDQTGCGVQASDRGACERVEGVMIAPSCSFHEFPLDHDALGNGADHLSRSQGTALQ